MQEIGYMQDMKACTDADGAYGIIIRLISQSGLDEETLDELVVEMGNLIMKARDDNTLTDNDLIELSAEKFDKKSVVIGMMMSAHYIRGVLFKYTKKYAEQQQSATLRADPSQN